MPHQRADFLPRGNVPEADRTASAPGGERFPLGRKGKVTSHRFISCQLTGLFACRPVPEPDRMVKTCRGEGLAIGGEDHSGNGVGMPLELLDFLAGGGFPNT